MPYQEAVMQQHGFIHAGILATILDNACGYAAFTVMPASAAILSIDFNINLLALARGDHFRFVGHVMRSGRTITVCRAEAIADENDTSIVVAIMIGTLMTVFGRTGIVH
jgi:uncharacterized protein (TIGR00369 family)